VVSKGSGGGSSACGEALEPAGVGGYWSSGNTRVAAAFASNQATHCQDHSQQHTLHNEEEEACCTERESERERRPQHVPGDFTQVSPVSHRTDAGGGGVEELGGGVEELGVATDSPQVKKNSAMTRVSTHEMRRQEGVRDSDAAAVDALVYEAVLSPAVEVEVDASQQEALIDEIIRAAGIDLHLIIPDAIPQCKAQAVLEESLELSLHSDVPIHVPLHADMAGCADDIAGCGADDIAGCGAEALKHDTSIFIQGLQIEPHERSGMRDSWVEQGEEGAEEEGVEVDMPIASPMPVGDAPCTEEGEGEGGGGVLSGKNESARKPLKDSDRANLIDGGHVYHVSCI
jgi:hypothetical protein